VVVIKRPLISVLNEVDLSSIWDFQSSSTSVHMFALVRDV